MYINILVNQFWGQSLLADGARFFGFTRPPGGGRSNPNNFATPLKYIILVLICIYTNSFQKCINIFWLPIFLNRSRPRWFSFEGRPLSRNRTWFLVLRFLFLRLLLFHFLYFSLLDLFHTAFTYYIFLCFSFRWRQDSFPVKLHGHTVT